MTKAPFIATPLMGWLADNLLVDAYELNMVELMRMAARTKAKNILMILAKIMAIRIKVLNRFNMYYWFIIRNFALLSKVIKACVTFFNLESEFLFGSQQVDSNLLTEEGLA
ncbi:MAG: hypothetical protein QN651_02700 [Nitrososphaeraceae archaeon]|nr:hypothetical protein [Nitrososphaeraceae archaeon]